VGPVTTGDALVVARELHLQGYDVVYCPFSKLKELTSQHAQYESVGILSLAPCQHCKSVFGCYLGLG